MGTGSAHGRKRWGASIVVALAAAATVGLAPPAAAISDAVVPSDGGEHEISSHVAVRPASGAITSIPARDCAGPSEVLSPSGRLLFVTDDAGLPFVCVVDVKRKKVVQRIRVHADRKAEAQELALSPDGRTLFVSVQREGRYPCEGRDVVYSVFVAIDVRSLKVTDSYQPQSRKWCDVQWGFTTFGLVANDSNSVDFIVKGAGPTGYILRADLGTKSWSVVSDRISNNMPFLAASRDRTVLWVMGFVQGGATDRWTTQRIDVASGRVTAQSTAGDWNWQGNFALSPDGRTVHTSNFDKREYLVLDATSLKVIHRVRLPLEPLVVSVSPDGNRIGVIARHPVPRNPVLPIKEKPDQVWYFDRQARKVGNVVLPRPGAAYGLVFSPSGREAHIPFRSFPHPAEVLTVPVR